jgi:AraC-like DNA-binding protein
MPNPKGRAPGVRREWMFNAITQVQSLVCQVALADDRSIIDIRASLCAKIPCPDNVIERYVLEGLIATTEQEFLKRSRRSSVAFSPEPLAERAARILRERLAEPWTIPRLARELGTNRFTLTTEFHAAFGMGVHEHLVRIRVQAAEERFDAGEKTESAAHDVGFRSKTTLYQAYRRVMGRRLRLKRRRVS